MTSIGAAATNDSSEARLLSPAGEHEGRRQKKRDGGRAEPVQRRHGR
jgi:hypothetical protein